jgi:hypothetical protein
MEEIYTIKEWSKHGSTQWKSPSMNLYFILSMYIYECKGFEVVLTLNKTANREGIG